MRSFVLKFQGVAPQNMGAGHLEEVTTLNAHQEAIEIFAHSAIEIK